MRRFLIFSGLALFLIGCADSGTPHGNTQDTLAPINSTQPTGTNPGGVQAINPDSVPQQRSDSTQGNPAGTGGGNSDGQ